MSTNPIELRKKDHGEENELPSDFKVNISTTNKDLIKSRYQSLIVWHQSRMMKSACYMQIFNINPKLIKLRLMRDQITNANAS
jgi:hypothetical protein